MTEDEQCPVCGGTGVDPGGEGDWVPGVGRVDPWSLPPCPDCHGRVNAPHNPEENP